VGDQYILVVDDDPGIRRLVLALLEDLEYPALAAPDGKVALQMTREDAPALVILDMRMPVMDGWEFSRRLRDEIGAIPIVVMTAARDASTWAEEIDASGFVAKPFDLDDLVRAIEDALPQPV